MKRRRPEEVGGRRHDRDAVVVGIPAEPVGHERGAVARRRTVSVVASTPASMHHLDHLGHARAGEPDDRRQHVGRDARARGRSAPRSGTRASRPRDGAQRRRRDGSSDPRCSLVATRAERIPASEPEPREQRRDTISSAGSRGERAEPRLDRDAGERAHRRRPTTRNGSDSPTIRRRSGECERTRDHERADARPTRAEHREHAGDHAGTSRTR